MSSKQCFCGQSISPTDRHSKCVIHRKCSRARTCKLDMDETPEYWADVEAFRVAANVERKSSRNKSKKDRVNSDDQAEYVSDSELSQPQSKRKVPAGDLRLKNKSDESKGLSQPQRKQIPAIDPIPGVSLTVPVSNTESLRTSVNLSVPVSNTDSLRTPSTIRPQERNAQVEAGVPPSQSNQPQERYAQVETGEKRPIYIGHPEGPRDYDPGLEGSYNRDTYGARPERYNANQEEVDVMYLGQQGFGNQLSQQNSQRWIGYPPQVIQREYGQRSRAAYTVPNPYYQDNRTAEQPSSSIRNMNKVDLGQWDLFQQFVNMSQGSTKIDQRAYERQYDSSEISEDKAQKSRRKEQNRLSNKPCTVKVQTKVSNKKVRSSQVTPQPVEPEGDTSLSSDEEEYFGEEVMTYEDITEESENEEIDEVESEEEEDRSDHQQDNPERSDENFNFGWEDKGTASKYSNTFPRERVDPIIKYTARSMGLTAEEEPQEPTSGSLFFPIMDDEVVRTAPLMSLPLEMGTEHDKTRKLKMQGVRKELNRSGVEANEAFRVNTEEYEESFRTSVVDKEVPGI